MCSRLELQGITMQITDSVLKLLADKTDQIVLYGSYARGDYTPESDVDIMIISNCTKDELRIYRKQVNIIASRIGLEYDIMISILLRDKETYEFNRRILPFYQNVEKEGIKLYG